MRGFKTCTAALVFAAAIAGCDNKASDKGSEKGTAGEAGAAQPSKAAEPAAPAPKRLPTLGVDNRGIRVGRQTVDPAKALAATELKSLLGEHRDLIKGKEISFATGRKVETYAVALLIDALGTTGATAVKVTTKARGDLPGTVVFTPLALVKDPPQCSVVATVHDDKSTAVWTLSGGTAGKSSPGMAGPDLTMTRRALVKRAKACSTSDVVFVSAGAKLGWGPAFDLAGATQHLMPCQTAKECGGSAECTDGQCSNAPKLTEVVLLAKEPAAGRPVTL